MATEEDNFDIDIYPDGGAGDDNYDDDEHTFTVDDPDAEKPKQMVAEATDYSERTSDGTHKGSTSRSNSQQGVKRKQDDREVEPGATVALMLDNLHWWTSEDDVRGWLNEADTEDDLVEISFNEHKVNGKSKGQAYVSFGSPQASTAAKQRIQQLTETLHSSRNFSVAFTSSSHNPYKTMPKDAPARAKEDRSGAYNTRGGYPRGDSSSYRGRGRGYERGGYNNRNFSGPAGGYNNGAFQNNQNNQNNQNMGMMGNNFGFTRGGMSSMRGNTVAMRGGRGGNMNNMMPMGFNPMMAGMGMQGESTCPSTTGTDLP